MRDRKEVQFLRTFKKEETQEQCLPFEALETPRTPPTKAPRRAKTLGMGKYYVRKETSRQSANRRLWESLYPNKNDKNNI